MNEKGGEDFKREREREKEREKEFAFLRVSPFNDSMLTVLE